MLVGLDIETTGLDRSKGHRLIQIGLSFGVLDQLVSYVQPEGGTVYDPEAMAVNRIPEEVIGLAAMQSRVDILFANQLLKRNVERNSLIAVGWNVGSFDLNFLRQELPHVAEFFSHRVLDLTGVCIVAAKNENWRNKKDTWHKVVADMLGPETNWNDAGYDATAALLTAKLLLQGALW